MVAVHEHIPVEQTSHIATGNGLNPIASRVTKAKAPIRHTKLRIREVQMGAALAVVLNLALSDYISSKLTWFWLAQ